MKAFFTAVCVSLLTFGLQAQEKNTGSPTKNPPVEKRKITAVEKKLVRPEKPAARKNTSGHHDPKVKGSGMTTQKDHPQGKPNEKPLTSIADRNLQNSRD